MTTYLSILLSVLTLSLIVNHPAAYAADQPELTKKEKRYIKRIAKKKAKKQINAILPLGSNDLAEGAVGTAQLENESVTNTKIASGAVDTSEIADGAITVTKLSAELQQGRKYYLTQTQHQADTALTACAAGYHMASMFEILDLSNLRYDKTNGETKADIGEGPPTALFGWVRTGSGPDTSGVPGAANCNAWFSNDNADGGTRVALSAGWGTSVGGWVATTATCVADIRVWCVQD